MEDYLLKHAFVELVSMEVKLELYFMPFKPCTFHPYNIYLGMVLVMI